MMQVPKSHSGKVTDLCLYGECSVSGLKGLSLPDTVKIRVHTTLWSLGCLSVSSAERGIHGSHGAGTPSPSLPPPSLCPCRSALTAAPTRSGCSGGLSVLSSPPLSPVYPGPTFSVFGCSHFVISFDS